VGEGEAEGRGPRVITKRIGRVEYLSRDGTPTAAARAGDMRSDSSAESDEDSSTAGMRAAICGGREGREREGK